MEWRDIEGAGGGGKGGGGHTPVEKKDTLRARQNVKLLFAVNDGEIDSISEIYLNRTPISQFSGATWEHRAGTVDQAVIPGFSEVESPTPGFASTEIRTETPYLATFTYDVTAVRLTFQLPMLRRVNDDGDIVGYKVQLDIRTKDTTGSSEVFYESTIKKGKASNPYSWDVRVERPFGAVPGQSWQIKVVRITPNDPNSKKESNTYIAAQTEIQHTNPVLTYPGTALIAVKLSDAAVFGNRIPEVTFRVKGRKFFLPTNYNPATRTYDESSAWDLSFKTYREWTDNPAWCLYGVLTELMAMDAVDIDAGAFYNLAKYADALIDDGNGGTEPRYTVNQQFVERENVPTFLTYLLTLCNANFTTNAYGQLSVIYDHAGQTVSKIATNANVIDGKFTYSSNDLEQRFSLVNVTYNDPAKMGDTSTATESDDDLITRYGLQTSDIVLAGCYSEAQAIRKARWAIWTNAFDTELVSWSNLLAGMDYRVGDLVKIQDDRNFGFEYQGRILSATNVSGVTTLNLDRAVELAAETYQVSFLDIDGVTITQKTVTQTNGTFAALSFSGSELPLAESMFLLETATKKPLIAKVVAVKKDGDGYNITAVRHSESKYAYIDGDVTVAPPSADFINPVDLSVAAPTSVAVSEVFASDGIISHSKLTVTWSWGTGAEKYQANYQLLWRRDGLDWIVVNDITTKAYDIINPLPGEYDIVVFAINPVGNLKSAGTDYIYFYRTDAAGSTLDPVLVAVVQGTAGTTFSTPDLLLEIQHNVANDEKTDKLLDYQVQVWDSGGLAQVGETYTVKPDAAKNGIFRLSLTENRNLFGAPQRQFQLKIYCRDLTGRLSSAKVVSLTNPAPAVVSFALVNGVGAGYVRITPPSGDYDVAGYKVWRSTTGAFVKDGSTEVYDGPDTAISIVGDSGHLYYYAVAAYDTFGTSGINISGEQSGTLLSADPDTYAKTGLDFTVNTPVGNRIYWTAGTIIKNGTTSYSVAAGQADWTTGTLYVYFNAAIATDVLQTTTSLAVAVGSGCYPLATYTGGDVTHLKGGDGSAFISGSQVIAGSIGAAALVAGSAVITGSAQIANTIINEAHISAASINNAAIKDYIQSTNYNSATHQGWKLDKAGNIVSYGSLQILDNSGNTILASGASGIDWGKVLNKEGAGNNLLENSTLKNSLDTYVVYSDPSNPATITRQYNANGAPAGYGSILLGVNGTADSVYRSSVHAINSVVPVSPGQVLEAQCKVQNFRGKCRLEVTFYSSAGAYMTSTTVSGGVSERLVDSGAWSKSLADFTLLWGFVTVPSGAGMATIEIRAARTSGSLQTDIYICHPYLGYAYQSQSQPSPWNAGSPNGAFSTLSQINSSNASTYIANAAIGSAQINDLSANKITAGTISAAQYIDASPGGSAKVRMGALASTVGVQGWDSTGKSVFKLDQNGLSFEGDSAALWPFGGAANWQTRGDGMTNISAPGTVTVDVPFNMGIGYTATFILLCQGYYEDSTGNTAQNYKYCMCQCYFNSSGVFTVSARDIIASYSSDSTNFSVSKMDFNIVDAFTGYIRLISRNSQPSGAFTRYSYVVWRLWGA